MLILKKPTRRWIPVAIAGVVLGGIGIGVWQQQARRPVLLDVPTVEMPQITTVTALGRLEPAGELISVTAPTSGQGSRIAQLLVAEGDLVMAGQPLAILDSEARLQASLAQAEAGVLAAKSQLAQVLAGAKTGEIEAQRSQFAREQAELAGQIETQRARIATLSAQLTGERSAQAATLQRIKAELAQAQTDCDRYSMLLESGAISAQQQEQFCLQAQTTRRQVEEAQANYQRITDSRQAEVEEAQANLRRTESTLSQQISAAKSQLSAVAEVRPVDVQAAEAEVVIAEAEVRQVQAQLQDAYITAPQAGQILRIKAWPGEQIGPDGLLLLGNTQQMLAITEVFESDVANVRLGATATVSSDSLPAPQAGTVIEIGRLIERQDVVNADPSENIDARIVEVKVQLDESEPVANYTNLQVMVKIER
ncbi:MAG: HlyD family efflux transporter periplasmic adaptor subunit [Cyanobacteria bacterium P01_H01_bin.15]